MHQFVASKTIAPSDFSMSNGAFICKYAIDFKEFLKDQKRSDDKWIAMCAHFLEMSYDFFRFVDGYRLGD